jgi:hypothetical protein
MAHPSQTAPKTVTSRGRVTVMAVHGFSVAMVHSTTRPAGCGPQEEVAEWTASHRRMALDATSGGLTRAF